MTTYLEIGLPDNPHVLKVQGDAAHWQDDIRAGKARKLPKAKGKESLEKEARKALRKLLRPGDTILTVLRHVSASGMSRRISLFVIKKNQQVCLDGYAIDLGVGEEPRGNHAEGISVGGCGMDMGFALVYDLGARLWPQGTAKPHGRRNGEPDSDGGYALKQRWM